MADKRLDQVTKVTDMAYVPVIMSDGSIGQIAKADLATVVAGILGNPISTQTGPIQNTSFNDVTENGIYTIYNQDGLDGPVDKSIRLHLVVERTYDGIIIQTASRFDIYACYVRTQHPTTKVWSAWQRIDNFGYNTLEELAAALKPLM